MINKATTLTRLVLPAACLLFMTAIAGAQVVFSTQCDDEAECEDIFRDHPGFHGFAFGDGDFAIDFDDFHFGRGLSRMELLGDKTLSKLESDARELARDIRRADDDERGELEGKLDEKLSQIFDYKNDKRRRAIEANERRLTEMRDRLEKRESARDDIINQRKDELLGTRSYLDW